MQAADSCKQKGAASVDVITADLSGPKGVDSLVAAAQKLGTVDVLVNNAGAYAPMSFDEGENKGQGPLDGKFSADSALQSPNLYGGVYALMASLLHMIATLH